MTALGMASLDVRSSLKASGVWLSHPWVDLLGPSALDTSPPERMVLLVGLVEFNEREY